MNNRGDHWTADAYLSEWPGDDAVMRACEAAIEQSGMTVVACTHKRFAPQGLTAVWILQESHFTLHTYPEHKYLSVDCYTCGDEGRPAEAVRSLVAALPARVSKIHGMERGFDPEPNFAASAV